MMAMAENMMPTAPEALVPSWLTKKGICHVVDGADHHADDGGDGKPRDNLVYVPVHQHFVPFVF